VAATTTTPQPTSPHFMLPHLGDLKGTGLDRIAEWQHWLAFGIVAFVLLFAFATLRVWLRDKATQGHVLTTAGLNYVTGVMGAGKSLFGVRKIIAAVCAGKYAVTNQELYPDWAEKVCRRLFPKEWKNPQLRAARIVKLEGLYVYETDLRRAMRYRPPCVYCGGVRRRYASSGGEVTDDPSTCSHSGPRNEASAVFVWDETHNDLNNRTYDGGEQADRAARAEAKRQRALIVAWATQLRKLGYSGYLLSQHHENTDAQLRRVCNAIIRLQNQRNAQGMWFLKVLPSTVSTLFLVYWYSTNTLDQSSDKVNFASIEPTRRERYWLRKCWQRDLYDSWATYHGIDAGEGEEAPIYLPAGGRGPGVAGVPPAQDRELPAAVLA
jgi:hypothetical protein